MSKQPQGATKYKMFVAFVAISAIIVGDVTPCKSKSFYLLHTSGFRFFANCQSNNQPDDGLNRLLSINDTTHLKTCWA
jgi:hypothetical protein